MNRPRLTSGPTSTKVTSPKLERMSAKLTSAKLERMSAKLTSAKLDRVALDCRLAPQDVLRAIDDQPWPFALTGDWAGGGAVVGCSPLVVADPDADPFALLDALPAVCDHGRRGASVGGGWFGWLGYRLGRRIEDLPVGPGRPVPLPEFHLAYYDHVLHLDRFGRWWFEALVGPGAEDRIARRLDDLRSRLAAPPRPAPAYAAPAPFGLSHTDKSRHLAAVGDCRERIVAGEIYQANICLRLETRWRGSVTELYARALDRISPARGGAFRTPWGGIASLSPELFLRRAGDAVVTAPIKGTIKRPEDNQMARQALAALRRSAKDAAEHVMIVDLMRNDLGRVCAYGTIEAPRSPEAEPHPGVWHLVTKVRGRLRVGVGNGDLLRATFPPGSVTGAPKVQAMRVISELEQSGREVYTGAIGFASPVAGLELSVAIRTFEQRNGRLWLGAGGGIVADSNPEHEFEEALTKARPLVAAIGSRIATEALDGLRIPVGAAQSVPDDLHDGAVAVR
jgi:para-aminobenzoate synthetase/4-amino-4-deoxychorismate lyase